MNKYIKVGGGNFTGNLLLTLKESELNPEAFINKELAGVKEKVDIDNLVSEVNSLLDMTFVYDPDDALSGQDSYNYEVGTQNLYDALLYSGYFRNSKELDKAYNDLLDMAEDGKASLEYIKAYLEAPSGNLKEAYYSLGDCIKKINAIDTKENFYNKVREIIGYNDEEWNNNRGWEDNEIKELQRVADARYEELKGLKESINIADEDSLYGIIGDNPDARVVIEDISYNERLSDLLDLINKKKFNNSDEVIEFIATSDEVDKLREAEELEEAIRIYNDEEDYEGDHENIFDAVAMFTNTEYQENNTDYLRYSNPNNSYNRVESSKVIDGISKFISDYGYLLSKDRVQHANGIGNNNSYEIFKGNECIGYLNCNSGIYGGEVYVYIEDLNGNRQGGTWELRPANENNKKQNRTVIFKENSLRESFDANSENTMETIRNYMNNYEKNTPNGGSVLFRTYTDGDYDYDVRIYPGDNGKNPEAWAEPYEYSKDEDGNEHWEALDNIITLDDFKIDMTDDELDKYAKKSIGIKEAFDYKAQFENQEGTEKEEGDNYTIYRYSDSNGKPIAVMFYGRTQRPNFHVRFNDEERREKYIQDFLDSKKQREEEKAERRKAQKLTKDHDIKVGDMFYTCWGYDQTNIDYYQVVDVRGSRIDLREIGQEVIDRYPGGEEVVPVKDSFTSDKIITISARADGTVTKISSFEYPSKWDGKPHHQTDGYSGH